MEALGIKWKGRRVSECNPGHGKITIDNYQNGLKGVSNLLASLGHTGRRRVVLGHILNTQTLTKTDEQKKRF